MPENELTPQQNIRLNLLRLVGSDTAAAKEAIEFVKDQPLRYQVFTDQFERVFSESEMVAKTLKAIKQSEDVLTLFAADAGNIN